MIPHVLLEVTGQAKIEMRHPESFNGEFPKIRDTFLRSPYNKDYSSMGSILGSPY